MRCVRFPVRELGRMVVGDEFCGSTQKDCSRAVALLPPKRLPLRRRSPTALPHPSVLYSEPRTIDLISVLCVLSRLAPRRGRPRKTLHRLSSRASGITGLDWLCFSQARDEK